MKEFIDKLIERLEGREKYYHECALNEIMENGHTLDAEGFLGKEDAYGDAISIVNHIAEEYKGKYVGIGAFEQVRWERDIAIEQLHELGYEFGQKVAPYTEGE